jgi:hypothetical protein
MGSVSELPEVSMELNRPQDSDEADDIPHRIVSKEYGKSRKKWGGAPRNLNTANSFVHDEGNSPRLNNPFEYQ